CLPVSTFFPDTTLFRSAVPCPHRGGPGRRVSAVRLPRGARPGTATVSGGRRVPPARPAGREGLPKWHHILALRASMNSPPPRRRSEEHTSELQSRFDLV